MWFAFRLFPRYRADAWREHPPALSSGLALGLQGFGFSLLGAVAGLADQPLRPFLEENPQPTTGRCERLGIVSAPLQRVSGAICVSSTPVSLYPLKGIVRIW